MNEAQREAKLDLSAFTIAHKSFNDALTMIRETMLYNQYTEANEPNCVLVSARSGAGKTTLCKAVEDTLPKPYTVEEDGEIVRKVPFFHNSLDQTCTPSHMSQCILEKLGMTNRSDRGVLRRVVDALQKAGTFGFNFDELHNLAGIATVSKVQSARTWLRDLITNTHVMVIGYGTQECERIFLQDEQVVKRFPILLKLENFAFSLDPASEYVRVVSAFERKIAQHQKVFEAIEPRMGELFLTQLYAATGGSINGIKKFYEYAMFRAFIGDQRFDTNKFVESAHTIKIYSCLTGTDNAFQMSRSDCNIRIINGVERGVM